MSTGTIKLNREQESREQEVRPVHTWAPPETLPRIDAREGWVHRWCRTTLMGAADPMNISKSRREGFEPVKAEDYPEAMIHASIDGQFKGSIEIGGLVLCRAPKEMMEQRAKHYAKLAESQMDSVDNTYLRENDPRMPMFKDRATKVTFGGK
jgi:hypothetical protein